MDIKIIESGWSAMERMLVETKLRLVAEAIKEDAANDYPVDTGELRNSGEVVPGEGNSLRVQFVSGHALYIEDGANGRPGTHSLKHAAFKQRGVF